MHSIIMKVHNIMEDIVHAEIESICAGIAQNSAYKEICESPACRLDAACYVLNRIKPRYFVSSRGLEREEMFSFEKQQSGADIIGLILEAFKAISLHQRPKLQTPANIQTERENGGIAAFFNVPAIIGKILDGRNFAPLNGINIALYKNGELLAMDNDNWQNPCVISAKTEGTFTFWPKSFPAASVGETSMFEFEIQARGVGFEPLFHIFELPLTSETSAADAVSMGKTLKLPSLYMFPPENPPQI